MSITYRRGDLFNAVNKATSTIIMHSCNCHGSWGGGFAYQCAKRFPEAEEKYIEICEQHSPQELLGKCIVIPTRFDNISIGCLFTSAHGGTLHDSSDRILKYTQMALQNYIPTGEILMPKINSGIFGVPWEETEVILKETLLEFTVYEF